MSELVQEEFLEMIDSVEGLPDINKLMFDTYSSIRKLKHENSEVFLRISLCEERLDRLKKRAGVLFDIEDVKTLPDSERFGTLTKVAGRRYIPLGKAQEMLEPNLYANLVETGKGHVRWTPPKEISTDD